MRDIPAGEGGNHQLRKTKRQLSHGRSSDRRAAPAAERDDAVDFSFSREFCQHHRRGLTHRHHALAAVAAGPDFREIDARKLRDFLAGDIGFHRRCRAGSYIDQQHIMPFGADEVREIGVFSAFGIESAENRDGGHDMIKKVI